MLRVSLEYLRATVSASTSAGPDFDNEAAANLVREMSTIIATDREEEELHPRFRVKRTNLPWVALFDARIGTSIRDSFHLEYVVDRDHGGLALLLGFGGLAATDAKQRVLTDIRADKELQLQLLSEDAPPEEAGEFSRLRQYAAHSVTSRLYLGELPKESELRADLSAVATGLRRIAGSQRWRSVLHQFLEPVSAVAAMDRARAPKEGYEKVHSLRPTRRYPVLYCTTRTPLMANGRCIDFARSRDPNGPHYGRCDVAIPKTYEIGPINKSWLEKLLASGEKRFHVEDLELLPHSRFLEHVKEVLGGLETDDRRLLLYIHGYNTDFFDAIARTAQLGVDLRYPGLAATFCWAQSKGVSKASYLSDWTSVQLAAPILAQFISDLSAQQQSMWIDVIAHSMGNRALLECIAQLASTTKTKLGHIILAAPDIQAVLLDGFARPMSAVARTRTLYVSEGDRALRQAETFDGHSRAGRCPPVTVVTGTDTVKIPLADWLSFGHSYFAEGHAVITDMHQLLHYGAPPTTRSLLTPQLNENGKQYWLLRVAT